MPSVIEVAKKNKWRWGTICKRRQRIWRKNWKTEQIFFIFFEGAQCDQRKASCLAFACCTFARRSFHPLAGSLFLLARVFSLLTLFLELLPVRMFVCISFVEAAFFAIRRISPRLGVSGCERSEKTLWNKENEDGETINSIISTVFSPLKSKYATLICRLPENYTESSPEETAVTERILQEMLFRCLLLLDKELPRLLRSLHDFIGHACLKDLLSNTLSWTKQHCFSKPAEMLWTHRKRWAVQIESPHTHQAFPSQFSLHYFNTAGMTFQSWNSSQHDVFPFSCSHLLVFFFFVFVPFCWNSGGQRNIVSFAFLGSSFPHHSHRKKLQKTTQRNSRGSKKIPARRERMGVRMSAFCGQATSLFCLFKARLANACFFAYIFSVKGESQEQSEHVDCVANTCTAQQGEKREVEVDQGKKWTQTCWWNRRQLPAVGVGLYRWRTEWAGPSGPGPILVVITLESEDVFPNQSLRYGTGFEGENPPVRRLYKNSGFPGRAGLGSPKPALGPLWWRRSCQCWKLIGSKSLSISLSLSLSL